MCGQNGDERPESEPRLCLDGNKDFITGNEMMISVLQEEEAWVTTNLRQDIIYEAQPER